MSAGMRWVWVRRAFHPHKQGALIEVPAQRAGWLITHGFAEGASQRTRRQSKKTPREADRLGTGPVGEPTPRLPTVEAIKDRTSSDVRKDALTGERAG